MTYLIILYIFIILNTVNEVLVLVCGVCVCVFAHGQSCFSDVCLECPVKLMPLSPCTLS